MIEYREKFYVSSDELDGNVPVESKRMTANTVAVVLAIGLLLTLVAVLEWTIS